LPLDALEVRILKLVSNSSSPIKYKLGMPLNALGESVMIIAPSLK